MLLYFLNYSIQEIYVTKMFNKSKAAVPPLYMPNSICIPIQAASSWESKPGHSPLLLGSLSPLIVQQLPTVESSGHLTLKTTHSRNFTHACNVYSSRKFLFLVAAIDYMSGYQGPAHRTQCWFKCKLIKPTIISIFQSPEEKFLPIQEEMNNPVLFYLLKYGLCSTLSLPSFWNSVTHKEICIRLLCCTCCLILHSFFSSSICFILDNFL